MLGLFLSACADGVGVQDERLNTFSFLSSFPAVQIQTGQGSTPASCQLIVRRWTQRQEHRIVARDLTSLAGGLPGLMDMIFKAHGLVT